MGTALARSESETDLCLKAAAFEIPAWPVDGMDVIAVEAANRKAVQAVRSGGGPHFLEFRTYRFRAHSMYDPELYRDKQEVEEWKKRDPIAIFTQRLKERGLWKEEDWARMEEQVAQEIGKAIDFAEAGTWEPVEDLTRFVYSEVQSSGFKVQGGGRGNVEP
jgi:TPP-dependent pyruvate/acetoin dehydrogenase alpha subunit